MQMIFILMRKRSLNETTKIQYAAKKINKHSEMSFQKAKAADLV